MVDEIRGAEPGDATAIRDIYAPFVQSTAVTFELEVPSVGSYEAALSNSLYPWLVLESDGEVAGYVKASRFHDRPAYSWSVEVAVYLAEGTRGSGAGTRLVTAMLDELRGQGYANAFAGIALPNPASVGLFESLGFARCALHKNVGYKLGSWHDVGWWQKALGPYPEVPRPVPASEPEVGR
jgi:phosphinothricin acetyltransferase